MINPRNQIVRCDLLASSFIMMIRSDIDCISLSRSRTEKKYCNATMVL